MKIKKAKEKFLNFLKPLNNKRGMEWIQIIFLIIIAIVMSILISISFGIPLNFFWECVLLGFVVRFF